MFFRLGVSEIIIITVICLLAIAFPSAVIMFLSNLSKRINNIEDNLKDKS